MTKVMKIFFFLGGGGGGVTRCIIGRCAKEEYPLKTLKR